jgi:hypothetical protein
MWAMPDVGKLSPKCDLQSCKLLNLRYFLIYSPEKAAQAHCRFSGAAAE